MRLPRTARETSSRKPAPINPTLAVPRRPRQGACSRSTLKVNPASGPPVMPVSTSPNMRERPGATLAASHPAAAPTVRYTTHASTDIQEPPFDGATDPRRVVTRRRPAWNGARRGYIPRRSGPGGRRGVVVDDAPALGGPAQQQGEDASRGVLRALQPPAAVGQSGVRSEHHHPQLGEIEPPHRRPIGVAQAVALEQRLPPERHLAPRLEPGLLRAPVGLHEAFQVAGVPLADLLVE